MKPSEKAYWVAFSAFPQIGPVRFSLIREYFGSAKEAYLAPIKEYKAIGLGLGLTDSFDHFRKEFDLKDYLQRLEKHEIKTLTIKDRNYPERLKNIADPPFLLYVKGVSQLARMTKCSLAVVGTRKPTSYGLSVTGKLVGGLVEAGVTVVSGLALGIDSLAHKKALEQGGKTIAVLGCGLDRIYPPGNSGVASSLVKSGRGALVSEYPLGYPISASNFPIRNRIVSGLSLGVVVVEGAQKSGSLITASAAAAQGREVFAVPGPVTSPMSAAPHFLLKNGAKLVENVDDILESL